ncbi:1-acyl-sn-glycerol-3-phosphate acyltransferase [Mycolicibacterium gilvum]|uniref:1-acyl-sn-glycerol-3-phosphate acyltransferase n=1 Tax=Mycolicibacterium gilvum TaxID=1804 RepID=A0A378SVI7_9MYCO|nr:1-acyl-sn-glycerol-3-phosphate acyltransferase [Mycolicibacterium gilvum]MCV7056629.1 1-acyl-sn-glycerol-3-phosphate acyltransferase [Mycolicibacterium gilvum]STZ46365.1 1-acyl-sn-glycerol-3-phosphate acyltransferase [Mycolicibacterium gilvum]
MSEPPDIAPPGWLAAAIQTYLRVYHRHEIQIDAPVPDQPALFVCNHGFGGVIDLNVAAFVAARQAAGVTRPTTAMVHQIAWTLGVGPLVERFGGTPGSREAAGAAFEAGHNVLVFPGGDVDAGKSWRDRNRITFHGSGFARLAKAHRVPIVPVVTAGAGESLVVLSNGQTLARTLQLPKFLRVKALPVTLSVPWGLNVGVVGLAPYLPMPTKLVTAVMPAMLPEADESADDFAHRVHGVMQARLDALTARRTPLLG